ncbi:methionyl-tRNA formyltransferase [Helicobacter baculiformis]|uniref:Methionyl-tRNA formyltransferase n=1 Tax=Helicobacter baculiformis TaxID=427351 RepID=A0ABV7ZH92_9HELI|nr:methionyl-tRNA formyltransferase [Helicobacter baculiformis]
MRLLFMGTSPFARIVLACLLDQRFEVIALFTQPSKPFGRTQALKHSATKEFLQRAHPHIPIFEPTKLDTPLIETIRTLKPDVIVVVAYGKILPQALLDIAPCLNLHGSILPQFRGASPMQEMILKDASEFGVSVIAMNAQMDAGDILGVARVKRKSYMNAEELGALLAPIGAQLLVEILRQPFKPMPQDHTQASYCAKITKQDGLVCFQEAKEVFLKALAYHPWPGVFLASGLKLFGVELVQEQGTHKEGVLLDLEQESALVGCAKGVLRIASVQAPSKQKMRTKAYMSGKRLKIGDVLG